MGLGQRKPYRNQESVSLLQERLLEWRKKQDNPVEMPGWTGSISMIQGCHFLSGEPPLLQRWNYGSGAQKGNVSCVSQSRSFISAVGSSNNSAAHLVVPNIIKVTDLRQRSAHVGALPPSPANP